MYIIALRRAGMHMSDGMGIGIKQILIIVIAVIVCMALIPILSSVLDGMGLTGSAADMIPWVSTLLVLSIIIPMIGFGISKVEE